jgi:uncharacterized membrane protein
VGGASKRSEDSEPTQHARVTIEKSREKVKAAMTLPANPTSNLLRLVAYVATGVGAIFSPILTFEAVPSSFPVWGTAIIVIGQEIILLAITLAVTFRTGDSRRSSPRP